MRLFFLSVLLTACVFDAGDPPANPPAGNPPPPAPTGGGPGSDPGSGSDPTMGGSGSSAGSGANEVFGPGEPQLLDSDGDGVLDAVDVEPDGDPDYEFDIDTCGEPRVDSNGDGHVDAIDIDCNGQVDLLVHADGSVSPAPGANCNTGEPGQGKGHGAAGYGCN